MVSHISPAKRCDAVVLYL